MNQLHRVADQVALSLARHAGGEHPGALLIAVSGGPDSTALACAVARLCATGRMEREVWLGHVHHGVHAANDAAAAAAARLATDLGLPFARRDLALAAVRRGGGPPGEANMRQARYAALVQMAREHGAAIVATAHHGDDNLETVLFRMMRGTGLRGLAGIPEARPLAPGLLLLRPLLSTRRDTLRRALAEAGVAAVEDPTNADLRQARNLLRHRTIPDLRRRLGVELDATLFALARSARSATSLCESQATRILSRRARRPLPWRYEIDLQQIDDAAEPFLAEVLRRMHQAVHPRRQEPPWTWVERAAALRAAPCGLRVHGRGGTLLAERTAQGILVVDAARAGEPPENVLPLEAAGVRFGSTEWWLWLVPHAEPPLSPSPREAGRLRALLDPSRTPLPWRLRSRRSGDRFWPLGAPGPVELRRFLQARHVPRFDRERLPLVVDGEDRVLWVPGVEVSELARVDVRTRACIELRAALR